MSSPLRWLLGIAILTASLGARADEVSGTFTGEAELRTNYYWERSTRVVAPTGSLRVDTPWGQSVRGSYLLDAITSASVGAGLVADVRFTEIRHQGDLSAEQSIKLGDDRLRIGLSGRMSREPDYLSLGAGANATLELKQQTTQLSAGLLVGHDEIQRRLRGGDGAMSATGLSIGNQGHVGELDSLGLSASWAQVVTKTLITELRYDLGLVTGYQANPYRMVTVAGAPRPELHPDRRVRHTGLGRIGWHLPSTNTSLHALYRIYLDSWGVAALTPEARIYQRLGQHLQLRGRYRHYNQTPARFFRAPQDYARDAELVSADPKLSRFRSHLMGLQALVLLDFTERSALDFARASSIELTFDYLLSSSRYGNAVIATVAYRQPF